MTSMGKHHWCFVALVIFSLLAVLIYYVMAQKERVKRPNIIVIIADDMGRNDVSFHGSDQIPTPNIDALGYNGIILDRFYTQYTCTPSRTAFLTGNYPIRSGMHGFPLKFGENRSLPLDMPTMPEQLKRLGYATHLVGKWHLGAAYRHNTPIGRGFDTHFGYWNGFVGYFDYLTIQIMPDNSVMEGLDLHDQFESVWGAQGKYATELFTEKSLEIIENHDGETPLFLVVSHLAPHTGKNGLELEVPNSTLTDLKYGYIKDPRRRRYADIVNLMDDSVGKIVAKLAEKELLKDSIVLFFSDNGAQTVGLYENAGSNWPLRGVKFTEFEGGVRCAAAIFSPLFEKSGYVNKELIHLADWLPTFYAAAGGNLADLGQIDGINQWDTLSKNIPTNRSELLLNINEVDDNSAIIMNKGRYKFLKGTYQPRFLEQYYGETGRSSDIPPYNITRILTSSTNLAIQNLTSAPITREKITAIRSEIDLAWCRSENNAPFLNCTDGCLFDLVQDPCETTNILGEKPEIAFKLYARIVQFSNELVPQKIGDPDPAANPIFYNNTWCTWLDDELCVKTPKSYEFCDVKCN